MCQTSFVNHDHHRRGERDEIGLVNGSALSGGSGDGLGASCRSVERHECLVVVSPCVTLGELHDFLVDSLSGRGVETSRVVAHDAVISRSIDSVRVGIATFIDANLT